MNDEARLAVWRYFEAHCRMMIEKIEGNDSAEENIMDRMDDLWWKLDAGGERFVNHYAPILTHTLMGYDTKWNEGRFEMNEQSVLPSTQEEERSDD